MFNNVRLHAHERWRLAGEPTAAAACSKLVLHLLRSGVFSARP